MYTCHTTEASRHRKKTAVKIQRHKQTTTTLPNVGVFIMLGTGVRQVVLSQGALLGWWPVTVAGSAVVSVGGEGSQDQTQTKLQLFLEALGLKVSPSSGSSICHNPHLERQNRHTHHAISGLTFVAAASSVSEFCLYSLGIAPRWNIMTKQAMTVNLAAQRSLSSATAFCNFLHPPSHT